MQRSIVVAVTAAALGATLLTGCGTNKKDRCGDDLTVIVLGTDGHYHYGSSTGSTVPDNKVPKSAQTAPGYTKPPVPAATPAKPAATPAKPAATPPKVNTVKPPAAPAKPATTGKR
jgi:hypothetical protein